MAGEIYDGGPAFPSLEELGLGGSIWLFALCLAVIFLYCSLGRIWLNNRGLGWLYWFFYWLLLVPVVASASHLGRLTGG